MLGKKKTLGFLLLHPAACKQRVKLPDEPHGAVEADVAQRGVKVNRAGFRAITAICFRLLSSPDVLAVEQGEEAEVNHVPRGAAVVVHQVQGQGHVGVAVVTAEDVLQETGRERRRGWWDCRLGSRPYQLEPGDRFSFCSETRQILVCK